MSVNPDKNVGTEKNLHVKVRDLADKYLNASLQIQFVFVFFWHLLFTSANTCHRELYKKVIKRKGHP